MPLPIITTWTHLKSIIDSKQLPVQYEYNTDGYDIFAIDNDVVYSTVIYNNSVPDNILYSQVQNDADKLEFLTSYAPNANHIMQPLAARDGYIVTVSPILISGKDNGSIARVIATDTSGHTILVGSGTAGTPSGGVLTIQGDPAGSALPISGTVTANAGTGTFTVGGTVTVTQATSSNLKAQIEGVQSDNSIATANPVLIGGQDGYRIQSLATDGYGNVLISSLNAVGSPPSANANPLLVAGWDGTNVVRLKLNTDGTLATSEKELATFTALAVNTDIANNKSMFSIVNASGSAVTAKISAIFITNVRTAAVTGVAGTFEMRRIVNHSGGTAITAIETLDTSNTLNGSITVRTGSTVTSESANLLWRTVFSTDEWGPGTADVESNDHIFQTMFPVWNRRDRDNKPIVLHANEGLTVKFATNSTAGTFDVMVVFTQE